MPRQVFERGLTEVLESVRLLASRVDKAIADSMEALRTRDMTLARAIVDGDSEINAQRWGIEETAVQMIALQAPVASDLREMVSILSIVTDLERIADHAEGIARIALFLGEDRAASSEPELWEMAEKVREMLRSALSAFLDKDEDLARSTCDLDDDVDRLYDTIHRHFIQRLAGVPHDAMEFDVYTHLMWCSHNLERIGDRATNICERAIFLVTGKFEEINISSY